MNRGLMIAVTDPKTEDASRPLLKHKGEIFSAWNPVEIDHVFFTQRGFC